MGLTVNKDNDQRFDVDDASAASAKYLKILDDCFSKETTLTESKKTFSVSNKEERLKFTLAAYNAGEGRIANAQLKAKEAGKNPTKWSDVKNYLKATGLSSKKIEEIQNYVMNVLVYAFEFFKKSGADKNAKNKCPENIDGFPKGGHWITKDGRHILIKNKKD